LNLLKEDKINYLNIGLMVLTAIAAYFFPFETFLLAYAYLGPLHYLTEISWLHDRNYFSKGKYDFLMLLIVGVLLSYAAFSKDFGVSVEVYDYFVKMNLFDKLLVFALFSSILFALVKNLIVKIVAILFLYVFVSGWLSPENSDTNSGSTMVFALTSLVPTLIHVYLFTGLFMLFGALKSRSKSGLWQMVGFVLVPVFLVFFTPVDAKKSNLTEYGKNAYYADGDGFFYTSISILEHFKLVEEPKFTNKQFLANFVNDEKSKQNIPVAERKRLNDSLKTRLNEPYIINDPSNEYYQKAIPVKNALGTYDKDSYWGIVFYSNIGIMLMRFIAFAYLYHYLNWFSKTEVIRWHKVPKLRFAAVIVLWIGASVFYAYDYSLGLSLLFFLSFSHVLLEFPLNIVSIVGIGKESYAIATKGFRKTEA
jgi:hypothetical protein